MNEVSMMIISSTQVQNVMKAYTDQNKTAKVNKSQGTSPTSGSDEVILSSQAQGMGSIGQILKAEPMVRSDKVQGISASIANGSYNISAGDVADKIIGRTLADQTD
jgi:negative regulator of flagellin synthesis FlgM